MDDNLRGQPRSQDLFSGREKALGTSFLGGSIIDSIIAEDPASSTLNRRGLNFGAAERRKIIPNPKR